jgi:hypothetical protein
LLRDLLRRTLIGREPFDVEEARIAATGSTTSSTVIVFTMMGGVGGEVCAKTAVEAATAAKAIQGVRRRL